MTTVESIHGKRQSVNLTRVIEYAVLGSEIGLIAWLGVNIFPKLVNAKNLYVPNSASLMIPPDQMMPTRLPETPTNTPVPTSTPTRVSTVMSAKQAESKPSATPTKPKNEAKPSSTPTKQAIKIEVPKPKFTATTVAKPSATPTTAAEAGCVEDRKAKTLKVTFAAGETVRECPETTTWIASPNRIEVWEKDPKAGAPIAKGSTGGGCPQGFKDGNFFCWTGYKTWGDLRLKIFRNGNTSIPETITISTSGEVRPGAQGAKNCYWESLPDEPVKWWCAPESDSESRLNFSPAVKAKLFGGNGTPSDLDTGNVSRVTAQAQRAEVARFSKQEIVKARRYSLSAT